MGLYFAITARLDCSSDTVTELKTAGCHNAWAGTEFACPCHGSKYDASGAVTNGPGTESLGTYEAKIEGDLVLIKVT